MELGRCLKHAYVISIVVLLNISASLFMFHHHTNATRCVEREREALLAIKQELVDEHDRLSSWGSGSEAQKHDCCRWKGVYCDNQTGIVLRLDLRDDHFWWRWQGGKPKLRFQLKDGKMIWPQLKGKISPKLIELNHLIYLDLSDNDFNGSQIPPSIGSLTNLRYLNLNSAGFGGQVPYHQFGNLTHLEYLNLGDNDFTHSVENLNWLHHLSSLKYLDLSDTNLGNVYDWLETVNKLPNLRNLTLRRCNLPPPIISNSFSYINSSKSLVTVALRYNNVTSSIFKWLCNYNTTLVYLDLYSNQLSGSLPDVFGNMSSLTHLDLFGNQLEGGIPDSFAKLCGLQYLSISFNNLSGRISNFFESLSCAQSSLEILDVSWNHLAGPFPDLTKFLALKTLYLYGNQLSGTIPESIGQMSKLETIYVSNNHLEGVISETHFSRLSKLQQLSLSSNSLVLDFHSEWVPPFQLSTLDLGSCKMGPLIPKWLRTQKNLDILYISDAGISDIIPSWFWDWSQNISRMDLSRNEIKGTILTDSGFNFGYEPAINLSWNQLEGPIPSFLSKASSLDLSNNKLSKVDSFLCATNVSNLSYLDLSSNQVSGELPDCWKHFEYLVFLDLSNNSISGNIPTTMGSLSSIVTLKLDSNILEGELPSSMKNCTNLTHFDLGENKISGPIPKWLGVGMPYLAILILRSNHFNGSMPSQLCHLTSIQVLDLSMNNFSGCIPKCLNTCASLAQRGSPKLTISHRYRSVKGFLFISQEGSYDAEISIIWKGILSKYKSTLGLVKSIDLSSNRLTGEIPSEITHLVGLVSLNLSRNHLTGHIPSDIGKLELLQSLDLSRNQIYGKIPTSLLQIYGLGYLNLSYNHLSGKIPIGTQLQNYDPSSFAGNPQLCGLPLARTCDPEGTGRPNVSSNQEDSDELITQGFYISLGVGFAVGFWGVCGSLIFKRSWRYAYYKFLNASNDWLYVKVALIRRKLKDVLN
ncbi:hypothetical protein M0R45_034509 [Rubus argutus]|uniref:Uncharacterized protein n=1 Tax=Rubus argutus TaxID=59490 RepID=A0AAW1VUP7_RUBAR